VDVMSGVEGGDGEEGSEVETETDDDDDMDLDLDGDGEVIVENGYGMEVARVYAGTMAELGGLLPGGAVFDVRPGSS